MDTKEPEALDPLLYSPVNEDGGMLGPTCLVVHDQPFRLADTEGEVVVLEPHCQVTDLFPIGCLIVISDQAYTRHVVSKLNDGVGVVHGHAVVGEEGLQEGTKHGPLRGPRV